jgi:hypothetical protein
MKSIKFLVALVLFTFTTAAMSAQGENKMKHKQKSDINTIKKELNLTEEQTQKVMEARTATQAKMKVLKADENMTREEKKAVFMEIREEQRAKVDAILTDEQKAKRNALREEKKAEMKVKNQERKKERAELLKARAEFDQKISEEDRQEIDRLREVLKKEKQERGRGMRGKDGARGMRSEFREANKDELESLKQLTEKYEAEIEEFLGTKEMIAKERAEREGKRKKHAASRFLLMEERK